MTDHHAREAVFYEIINSLAQRNRLDDHVTGEALVMAASFVITRDDPGRLVLISRMDKLLSVLRHSIQTYQADASMKERR